MDTFEFQFFFDRKSNILIKKFRKKKEFQFFLKKSRKDFATELSKILEQHPSMHGTLVIFQIMSKKDLEFTMIAQELFKENYPNEM
jgi:hypothetical protein